MKKKKVLLMGKSGSGKSSMKSIIFNNYVAKETRRLGATIDVDQAHVKFLGNLTLNLWDCGGQDSFMENFLQNQRGDVFSGVALLIYVFDIESRDFTRDLTTFRTVLEALYDGSPDARLFCLFHKMDLVQELLRESLFYEREAILRQVSHMFTDIVVLGTSIWDETLYKAWSSIVQSLIPNTGVIEAHLKSFAELVSAEEVVLFERTTFLVVAHVSNPSHGQILDPQRFEKVSSIIKSFKLSCGCDPSLRQRTINDRKVNSEFLSFELRTGSFSAFIDRLTPTTQIMIVIADPTIESAATMMNLAVARKHFEKLEKWDTSDSSEKAKRNGLVLKS